MPENDKDPKLEALLEYIRDERGFDFTGYKRLSLGRRIAKRMHEAGIDDYEAYREYLEGHQDEFVHLFNMILINVTAFFRDDAAWDFLAKELVPKVLEAKRDKDDPVRAWSTGCATGEEAYSVAMVLAEALGEDDFKRRVKIYATDVDEEALTEGRHAIYSAKAVEPVPADLRDKYFERHDSSYAFRSDLRRTVIFGRHDLIQDPPISKVDLLLSRNTLMYFNQEAQSHILRQFHFALRDSGFLVLGKAEAIATRSKLFTPVDLRRKVFRRVPVDAAVQLTRSEAPPEAAELEQIAHESLIREAGFETAPIAQLVVDKDGKLALTNLQARMFFSLTPADIGKSIQDLEVSYRPVELRSRIDQAYADRHTITLRDVEWRVGEELRYLDIQIVPLVAANSDSVGCGITFTDVTRYQRLQQALSDSKRDADTASEELQSTVEELETTNEELQSTNEELETTNEELQSTNEELETMNEELQSTNEELSTINDELQQRTDELNELNAFNESILATFESAVVVIDGNFQVYSWNAQARDLWGLTEEEARGSHLLNLDIGLPVDQLRDPIKAVLGGGSEDGEVVIPAVNRRGRSINTRVQFSPLTIGGGVKGVILQMDQLEAG
jgi:two-component system, chemotaxis family, CheB/CheR fusion protein